MAKDLPGYVRRTYVCRSQCHRKYLHNKQNGGDMEGAEMSWEGGLNGISSVC